MALSANRNLVEQEGKIHSFPVAAEKVYKNALVKINAAGFVAPAAPEAGSQFAGVAYEAKDNSAGAAGDLKCRVEMGGVWLLSGTGFAQADVGSKVYAVDDDTVTLTEGTTSKQIVGNIVEFVSSTQVYVRLTPFAGIGASV